MEIRVATKKDAVTLSALNVEVQKIHADALPKIFKQPETDRFAVQFMLERLDDPLNHFFIANLNGVDIGYIYARIIDRPGNPFMHPWKYIYIDQISVKNEYRRMGCGGRLLDEVIKLAKDNEIDTIMLDTWLFNEQAQSFFRKQGFVSFNERMWITKNSD